MWETFHSHVKPGSINESLSKRTWQKLLDSGVCKKQKKVSSIDIYSAHCTDVLSHGRLSATPWTAAHQALLSMEFSRHKYWSGVPFPSPLLCIVPEET